MKLPVCLLAACLILIVEAHAATIEITPDACDQLANYHESPGVEYQPGIDAFGHPVAPADIGPGLNLPKKLTIPISSYLASKLPQNSAAGVVEPQLPLGVVTLENGVVSFNGQPIDSELNQELAAECRKAAQGR